MVCFHTACRKPPGINDGSYNDVVLDKYIEGQIVSFTCNDKTLTQPSNGQIVCGDSGWVENATCTRSSFDKLVYFVVINKLIKLRFGLKFS